MNKILEALNLSDDIHEFIETYNKNNPDKLGPTILKPKSCKYAFANHLFYITDCFKDSYDKAGFKTQTEWEEILIILKSLNHKNLIRLFHYDFEKDIMIWENAEHFLPLNMSPIKVNLLNNFLVHKNDLVQIREQLENVAQFLETQNLTHIDFEAHNVGFNEKTKEIKLFDILSIKKISDKYTSLFDRGQMERPDKMNPPFIKFFDLKSQTYYPKVLVLGNLKYAGKPCLDTNKEKINSNLGLKLASQYSGDYYHYSKIETIYTLYEYTFIVLSQQERVLFFLSEPYMRSLYNIGMNIIFLNDNEKLYNIELK